MQDTGVKAVEWIRRAAALLSAWRRGRSHRLGRGHDVMAGMGTTARQGGGRLGKAKLDDVHGRGHATPARMS